MSQAEAYKQESLADYDREVPIKVGLYLAVCRENAALRARVEEKNGSLMRMIVLELSGRQ